MGFSLGNLFDPAGVFSGDKGDIVGNILDPIGGTMDNFGLGEYNPLGDTHDDVNSWMDDMADVNSQVAQDRWRKVRENPQRLAYTGGDLFTSYNPVGTRALNKVEGNSDPTAAWDMYGGKTEENYQNAERRGMDTSNSRGLGQVGSAIGKGILNAYTFGLGSTAVDALNNYGYDQSNDDLLKNAAKNYAINYVAQGAGDYMGGGGYTGGADAGDYAMPSEGFDLGKSMGAGSYAPVVNQTAKGVAGGAFGAAANGGNSSQIGNAALQSGIMGGAKAGVNMAGDYLGNMFQGDDPDNPFTNGSNGTLGGMRDDNGDTLPMNQQPSYTTEAPATGMRMQPMSVSSSSGAPQGGPVSDFISAYTGGGGKSSGNSLGNYGDMAASMFGMYNARKQKKALQEQQSQLQNLFSPNSPYAQMARQRMERQDAAGGRRSQYGNRETQLAALLADKQASTMPQQERYAQGIGGQQNAMVNAGLRGAGQLYNNRGAIGNDIDSLLRMFQGGN